MVDTTGLGPVALNGRGGSSPLRGTIYGTQMTIGEFIGWVVGFTIYFLLIRLLKKRNDQVHDIRVDFMDRAYLGLVDWEAGYDLLPSYEQMLYNPRYWLLTKTEHWVAWVNRKKERLQYGKQAAD